MTAWNERSRACLAEPPAESPSTRKSSQRSGSCSVQSASLPGSAGPLVMRLRVTRAAALVRSCALPIANCAIFSPASGCWLSQSAKASFTTPETKAADSRDESFSLVCPANCGIRHPHRQDEGDTLPHVLGRELEAARHEIPELAELAHGIGHSRAQSVHVSSALRRRDQVDVAFGDGRLGIRRPAESPVGALVSALHVARVGLLRQAVGLAELLDEIGPEVAREVPLLGLAGFVDLERNAQSRAKHGLRLQDMLEPRHRNVRRIEVRRIRPEPDRRSGLPALGGADCLELRHHLAVAETDVPFAPVAAHVAFEVLRERIDDRDADAVQAAGLFVALVREFSAGVQARQDQLDAAHLLLRVDVHRHAAAVVLDGDRSVLVNGDRDGLAMARERLVDAVVDDLVHEVVGAPRVRVHPRTPANGFESLEDLDVRCGVRLRHA